MHVNHLTGATLYGHLHVEIYRKKARDQSEHPDQAPAFTPTVRTPQCGHTVWVKMYGWSINSHFICLIITHSPVIGPMLEPWPHVFHPFLAWRKLRKLQSRSHGIEMGGVWSPHLNGILYQWVQVEAPKR